MKPIPDLPTHNTDGIKHLKRLDHPIIQRGTIVTINPEECDTYARDRFINGVGVVVSTYTYGSDLAWIIWFDVLPGHNPTSKLQEYIDRQERCNLNITNLMLVASSNKEGLSLLKQTDPFA